MGQTEHLVDQARRGDDSQAYEALFARVAERLLLYLRVRLGRLGTALDPLDVLQETYIEAHRSFATFRGEGAAFVGWLMRIADHRLLDLVDHHGAQKRQPEHGFVPTSQVVEQLRARERGPSTNVLHDEAHERLRLALARLPDDEREAILLHYFQELSLNDVATSMNRSIKAVRTLLARARYALGAALEAIAGP